MPQLEVPDKSKSTYITYEVCGQGNPIVLIHGWLCSAAFWEEFKVVTGWGYQLILPNLRGHGDSPTAKDVAIKTMAEDINLLLEHLNISKAIIIGHSMGGLTAQAFYHAHPDKVIALGLWNTGGKIPFGYGIGSAFYVFRIANFLLGLLLSYPIRPLFRFVLAQGWKLGFKGWGKSDAYRKLVPIVKAMKPYAIMKAAFALPDFKGFQKLKDISVPTMLLHGMADKHITIIQMAKKMEVEIPNSKLYTVENAAHFPPNEQPEETLSYLREFLNTIPSN
jgi:pimeloyl-ACP methyl ester carboxylesterase